jgi:GT2 family glycosyltransferase
MVSAAGPDDPAISAETGAPGGATVIAEAEPTDARGPGASSSSRLSVVIVDHHRPDLLADALRALYASTRRPDEVIVVEVDAQVAPELPADAHDPALQPCVLVCADNPGYAAACNRGAAQASGDWILFMNADVTVSAGCPADVLAEAESDPGIGIATPRLVRPDGRLDHACHRGIPSVIDSLSYKARLDRLFPRSRRLGHYRLAWLDERGTHDVEACSGAFLLIRRSALSAVGGWDERYWFYAEDLDLCLRVTQAGWRVRYVGSTSAVHVKGSSSNLRRSAQGLTPAQRATRRRVREAVVDSHERFYRQHLQATTAPLLRPLVALVFRLDRARARRLG